MVNAANNIAKISATLKRHTALDGALNIVASAATNAVKINNALTEYLGIVLPPDAVAPFAVAPFGAFNIVPSIDYQGLAALAT
jgi:hypothetical protein